MDDPASEEHRGQCPCSSAHSIAMIGRTMRLTFYEYLAESCTPMPLEFERPHPGGMVDNSPTFQRWVCELRMLEAPKGRLKLRGSSAVPSGLHSILSLFPKVETRLKPWAIIASPFGRKTWR